MKVLIVLVLLGVCAIQTTPAVEIKNSADPYILELVQKIIDDLIQRAQTILKDIREQWGKLLESVLVALQNFVTQATDSLEQYAQDIENQVNYIGENVMPCIEKHRDDIQKVMEMVRARVAECLQKAGNDVNKIHEKVGDLEKQVSAQLEEIHSIISGCTGGTPIQTVACVLRQANKIGEALRNIAQNAREIIQVYAADLRVIAGETRMCVVETVAQGRQELQKIAEAIKDCINNQ